MYPVMAYLLFLYAPEQLMYTAPPPTYICHMQVHITPHIPIDFPFCKREILAQFNEKTCIHGFKTGIAHPGSMTNKYGYMLKL